jgi:hypothetical protein
MFYKICLKTQMIFKKGSLVRCGSSGRGRILVGDSEGSVHSISRQFETKSVAHAHLKGLHQIHQLKSSPFVVTLGVCSRKFTIFFSFIVIRNLLL